MSNSPAAPTAPVTATVSVPSTWDMLANSTGLFPKSDEDRLASESGYYVWSHRMKQALQYVGLWEIVTGTMLKPGAGVTGDDTWIKMNAAASAMILQCIKTDLVVKIIHLTSAAEIWTLFASEYSQVGSGSIMYWFSRLTRHMSSGGDISAHITGFQEATRYLANAKFIIPESVMAAILLSTLPSDPKDPESWDYFIKGI